MHAILIKWHPMLSADGHTDLMPPAVGSPWHPHLVGSVLWGLTLGKIAPTVKALNIEIIHMGSDIANGIPHIPIPPTHFLLALIYTAFSGSKSHFGPSAVQTKDGVVGAALLVIVQPNLNCFDVVPLPTGWVCAPNTVMAHMTLGDILGGFFAMGVDAALQALMNKAGSALNNRMGSQAGKLLAGPLATYLLGTPLGKTGLDGLKAITPESWHGTIDTLAHIPGFPGSLGVYQGYASDAGRGLGNIIGDGISGGETRTDRLFGRSGSYANQSAPAATQQSAPVQQSTPLDGVTNNPSVEEF